MTKIAGDRGLMDGKDAIDLLEKQIAARVAAGVEMSMDQEFFVLGNPAVAGPKKPDYLINGEIYDHYPSQS